MKRHISTKHDHRISEKIRKRDGSDNVSDSETNTTGSVDNDSVLNKRTIKKNNTTDNETEEDEKSTEEEDCDEEEDDTDDDDNETENKAWRIILSLVLSHMEFESVEDLYRDEDTFKEVIKLMQKQVEYITSASDAIKHGKIYRALSKEEDRLLYKCKYKPFEAEKLAWYNRRYLLKKLLKNNKDFIADTFLSRQPNEDVSDKDIPVNDVKHDWMDKLGYRNNAFDYF
jgi:hypothetical protein